MAKERKTPAMKMKARGDDTRRWLALLTAARAALEVLSPPIDRRFKQGNPNENIREALARAILELDGYDG